MVISLSRLGPSECKDERINPKRNRSDVRHYRTSELQIHSTTPAGNRLQAEQFWVVDARIVGLCEAITDGKKKRLE